MNKWQGEALFASIEKRARNSQAFRQLLEDEFSRTVSKLVFERQSHHPLHEQMIQDWAPHLERSSHAHAVHLRQDVCSQVRLHIEIHQTTQRFGGRRIVVIVLELPERINPVSSAAHEIIREKGAFAMQCW